MKTVRFGIGISTFACALLLLACGGDKHTTVSLRLSPPTTVMEQGATQQFSVFFSGGSNQPITWSVQEASGGTINPQGIYIAPTTAGIFHVVATCPAHGWSQTAEITIRAVSVTITPTGMQVDQGDSYQFTATITGTVNHAVTWSVQEGAAGGSINASGVYTAPAVPGTYHIIATSTADNTKTATTAVMVPQVSVSITPADAGVVLGYTRTFHAFVIGTVDDRVTWTVQEGSIGGVISGDGVYAPPPGTLGTYHVVATSVADVGKSAVATVEVVKAGFIDTGAMAEVRAEHTATLLSNGKVLLAGGIDESDEWFARTSATAELFDPATATFQLAGTMSSKRFAHTATFVGGKVLIAGGAYADDFANAWVPALATTDLYDPATAQFTAATRMGVARAFHSATKLNDGKVLIAGGYMAAQSVLSSAELYDSTTGAFTPTGSMNTARAHHTATLLSDGRVLVTGGENGNGAFIGTAEIFDPASGKFGPAIDVPACEARTATGLKDGRVLLAGGAKRTQTGSGITWVLCDPQLFDPVSANFSTLAPMNTEHGYHTATLLNTEQVLIAGGLAVATTYDLVNAAELYDPATSTFLKTGSMSTARWRHTETLLQDGRVLLTGGTGDKSAELFVQLP